MPKEDDLHKKKVIAMEKAEARLAAKVKAAENKLLQRIIDNFIDELDTKGGIIISNNRNISLTTAIDKIVNEFNKTVNTDLLKAYVTDVNANTSKNKKFFARFEESKGINFKKTADEVQKRTLQRLGIKPDGSLRKGGFIDTFSNNSQINLQLKEIVTKGVTGGSSLRQMKDELRGFVKGSDGKTGKLFAHYNTFIFDTYAQIDRLETGLYAEALGLKAFRYVGGTIKTTRHFCCQRNNLIFTTDEAQKWSSLSFQGKTTPYNPLIDLGGYNCRHTTQYISNRRAAALRGDLKLNDKGQLVKNPGGKRQVLNQC